MRTKISVAEMAAFKIKHKRHRRTKAEMAEFRARAAEIKPITYEEQTEKMGKTVYKCKITKEGIIREI